MSIKFKPYTTPDLSSTWCEINGRDIVMNAHEHDTITDFLNDYMSKGTCKSMKSNGEIVRWITNHNGQQYTTVSEGQAEPVKRLTKDEVM